jgi:hypothetical protein
MLLLSPALLFAQKKNKNDQGNDPTARATVLHVANLYVMADSRIRRLRR